MNTESLDPRYVDLDRWPTRQAVEAMLEGQMAAIAALYSQTAAIAAAAEAAAVRLGERGRLIFVGAGTSGRLVVQDGSELYPTFNWPPERTLFLMAGGLEALTQAREGAEDDAAAGAAAIAAAEVGADDVVIGAAASGRTPYTVAAIDTARARGALTIAIVNNPDTVLAAAADHPIEAVTGSEVLAGSTRMKAGTAQKAALNLLSTTIMLRLDRVYDGRMVTMRISNAKLLNRARRMVRDLSGAAEEDAAHALDAAGGDIRLGVIVARGVAMEDARALLEAHHGNLRAALAASGQP
ncbi:N-acetylmuramic acid 6-phosphate etherase [Sphingomonas endophytica]|uniref:N-acetylmuramic acid-6-phosphate etherase n=1 Tax=Sphingomonas endophytica TaxID=869719 RepID=A0A147I5G6_9SPHN|nr:N-acetylmuramic acid 6-phosphate etherase [Sphingomonas endophytica]KTT73884.1 N-acetylmuramic acid-6-phosphate etherase [Sphingomonas endophytica]